MKKKEIKLSEFTTNAKKKFNKRKIAIMAAIGAGIIAISGIITSLVGNKQEKSEKTNSKTTTSISTTDLSDLGTELEFPVESSTVEYGNTTGNVKKEEVVKKENVYYVNSEAASKSDKVGSEKIDTKKDTLKVESNGKVVEKNKGYEIKDKNNKVVSKGEFTSSTPKTPSGDPIPNEYTWDKDRQEIVPEKDEGKYVYADNNYYSKKTGLLIVEKGTLVLKTTLERAKKDGTTVKPNITSSQATSTTSSKQSTTSTTSSKQSTSSQATSSTTTSSQVTSSTTTSSEQTTYFDGKLNPDGTYDFQGLIFKTKADFEQWIIQGCEGYAIDSRTGLMVPEEELIASNNKTK